jgi:2,4-dienoyl-CoA reductase-like NADH-dependent reductase (Old Yellow Enzyme family)
MNDREILLSQIQVGTQTSVNRFFSQAMECNAGDADGNPTDLTNQSYENLFKGEAGMIIWEAITITDKNCSRMNQLFIMPKNQPENANGNFSLVRFGD